MSEFSCREPSFHQANPNDRMRKLILVISESVDGAYWDPRELSGPQIVSDNALQWHSTFQTAFDSERLESASAYRNHCLMTIGLAHLCWRIVSPAP